MTDRSRAPVSVTAMRIGRTDVGQGSILVDDDALTIMVQAAIDEKPIRIPLSSLDAITLSSNELALSLRGGPPLSLVSPAASAVRDELFARCRAIPELTRALRAFGSRRGHRSTRQTAPTDQQRFFAPLLDARRAAGSAAGPLAVLAAFDAPALVRSFEEALRGFAAERYVENAPARRALEAELSDLAEPLLVAIQLLGAAATSASESVDDLRLWRVWSAQLHIVFEVADRVWLSLDVALDAAPWAP